MTIVSSSDLALGAPPALVVKRGESSALGMSDMRLPTISSLKRLSEVVSLMYSHGALGRDEVRFLDADLGLPIFAVMFGRYEADEVRGGRSR